MNLLSLKENKEKLILVDLPYDYSQLQPVLSQKNVKFHYENLSGGYVERFNDDEGDKEFNKAGAFLHNIWWPQLQAPKVNNLPRGTSLAFIDKHFNTFFDFKDTFIQTALDLQGSGWVYLSKSGEIKTIKNHAIKTDIVLLIDVWEHAYYMDYPADRKSYMKSIWRTINWNAINDRLNITLSNYSS